MNAILTVTGLAKVRPFGPNTQMGESAAYPAGAGSDDRVTVMVTSPFTAPAGIESVTPSAVTSPPLVPIVVAFVVGFEGDVASSPLQPGASDRTVARETTVNPSTKRERPMIEIVGGNGSERQRLRQTILFTSLP
jgi:hypothetical protein